MDNVTIGGQYYDEVHGSSIPGPIWRDAMDGALGEDAKSFDLEAKYGLTQARSGGYNRSEGGGSNNYNRYYGGYNRYNGR